MTNPYESNSTNDIISRQGGRTRRRKPFFAIALLMSGPLWLVMGYGQSQLLVGGIINTKDLAPFVGNETGTISEYLLNVWHWEAALFLLGLATIPNTVIGFCLLHKGKRH